MRTERVTKRQAERVLGQVKQRYKAGLEPLVLDALVLAPLYPEPTLVMDYDGEVAIMWEDGPSDWAHVVCSGGASEEDFAMLAEVGCKPSMAEPVKFPAGVHCEPIMSFVLGIYPE